MTFLLTVMFMLFAMMSSLSFSGLTVCEDALILMLALAIGKSMCLEL